MPAVGGFVFDSSGTPIDREIRVYRRDTGAFLGKTRSSGGGGDPHFDKVSLLLHMDGADGSTTFTDNSMSPKQVTADGSAKISTAQSKFGGASAYFDGTSFIKAPASQSWSFGASDFTIECYFYIAGDSATTVGGTKIGYLVGCGPSSGSDTRSWHLAVDGSASSTGTGLIFGRKDSSGWESVAANITLTKAVWRHVAVAKSGSTVRIFLDGTLQAAANLVRNTVLGDYELKIGGLGFSPGWEQYFNGYIDDVRITNGVARYTTNFTPPAARLPDIPVAERTLAFGEYYFPTGHTGEVNVVCLDDASAPLENDLILRTFPV